MSKWSKMKNNLDFSLFLYHNILFICNTTTILIFIINVWRLTTTINDPSTRIY